MSSLHQLLLPLLAVFHIYIITSIEINSGRSLFYCSLWVSFSILPNSLFGVCVLQLVATRCWWIDAVRCKDHFPALQTFIRHLSFSYYGPCSNKEGRTFASYARLLLLTITTRQRRLFPIGTALRKVFFCLSFLPFVSYLPQHHDHHSSGACLHFYFILWILDIHFSFTWRPQRAVAAAVASRLYHSERLKLARKIKEKSIVSKSCPCPVFSALCKI